MAILVARDESKRPLTHDIPPTNAVMRQPNRSTNDPVNGPRENIKANPTEPTQAGREQNSLNHCAVTVSGYSHTCIMRPSFTQSPSIKLSLAIVPEIISLNFCKTDLLSNRSDLF